MKQLVERREERTHAHWLTDFLHSYMARDPNPGNGPTDNVFPPQLRKSRQSPTHVFTDQPDLDNLPSQAVLDCVTLTTETNHTDRLY